MDNFAFFLTLFKILTFAKGHIVNLFKLKAI